MKQHIIDYIKQFDHTLVSPIWGGEKAFDFLCYGHLDMSAALGFELEQATPVLTIVKENQLTTEEQLNKLIEAHEFDYSGFENEIHYLRQMKTEHPDRLCGGCSRILTCMWEDHTAYTVYGTDGSRNAEY